MRQSLRVWLGLLLLAAASPALADITGLAVNSKTTGAYTLGFTSTGGSATTRFVACVKDTPAPDDAEITAGTCDGGATALAVASKTTDGADTIVLGGSITSPVADIYGVHGSATVASLTDELLTPADGFQYKILSSVASPSFCDTLNATITPDIAAGDVVKVSAATSPGAYAWTQEASCEGEYTDGPARQAITISVYDTSAGAWMSGGPLTLYFNNQPPVCAPPTAIQALKVGIAMSAISMANYCSDPEGDVLTYAVSVGTLPTGMALSGTNNVNIGGTPTVENEAGATFTDTATDIAGATASVAFTFNLLDTVTAPNCAPLSSSACTVAVEAKWLNAISNPVCNAAAVGTVLNQIPAAGVEVQPFTNVLLSVSAGPCLPTPEVRGLSRAAALSAAAAAGITAITHEVASYCMAADHVLFQSPPAGADVGVSNLHLYVSTGDPPGARPARIICADGRVLGRP